MRTVPSDLNLEISTPTDSFSSAFKALLAKRNISDPESFLKPALSNLYDPFVMKGMKEAVERVRLAVSREEKILIHGDYDVDGVTAAAIVAKTLVFLGATPKTFLPDRNEDGYGVSARAIERGKAEGVSLLITADCGITAEEEVKLARSLGMDVIIIDHHRIPASGLPPATVILNPLQAECPYPFKDLSAGGLAFKLSQALIGEKAFEYLDLAATSTVCDVAPLKDENRIIVKNGLTCLSERKNPGIRAILDSANVKVKELNTGHIGFMLGPRINAAGRMSSPGIALQLMLTGAEREAQSLAQVLEEENKSRQREEKELVKEAIQETERTVNFNRDRVIIVGRQGWHVGVIGIVASRLVDRFHRPAIVIGFDGEKGKGSGRSIKGFHLFNAMQSGADCLEEFGGHEQAAGLSILETNLKAFREKVNAHARETYAPEIFIKKVPFDLEIQLDQLGRRFVKELELLEPHGAGNPRPLFLTKDLQIKTKPERLSPQTIKFFATDGILTFEAFWSDRNEDVPSILEKDSRVNLIYSLKSKEWQGRESFVLEVKEIKPAQI